MRKIFVSFLAGIGLAALSAAVHAETGQSYFGVGYHMGTYDESGFPKANPTGLKIKAGKYISENLAMEGHFTLGMQSDTVKVYVPGYGNLNVDIDLKNAISLFLKADLPLAQTGKIYGLFGFTRGELEGSALGYSYSEDDSGLSYGFGIDIKVNQDMYLGGEYIMYIDESGYDYSGINLGITSSF